MKTRILFTLLAVTAGFTAQAESKRPNIILAMADDQGWGDMGYMGHKVLKTPVFDEMAKTGHALTASMPQLSSAHQPASQPHEGHADGV